jgi:metal-sulfur cluster biosynthetic enzyme
MACEWVSVDTLLKDLVEQIQKVRDPETNRLLSESNIILEISRVDDETIRVVYSPFSPASPVAVDLGRRIREAVSEVAPRYKIQVVCRGHLLDDLVNRLLEQA